MKSFYITTAIDYVNGSPHIGHAYEKVLVDVIARFRRLMGDPVHFLTGTDEHGQKVQMSARKRGIPAQEFVDATAGEFRALYDRLDVSYDDFIRTTEERHKRVVCELLQRLYDKGEIYRAEYRGFYSTRQEQFLQEKDRLPDGSWPEIFGEVTEIIEPNYFFKLRAYQDWLVEYLRTHEDFIFPRFRQKQVLEFLKEPLNDLCISRPKERLEWGIPLPFDAGFVTYVWFDALVNYVSGVWKDGAPDPAHWPADFHVIGKDILTPPHAVYWPIMLHAAGIEPPKSLLVHGWWLLKGGQKMSKSAGEVVNPLDLIDRFGVDAFRYFLIREMNVGQDSEFSLELFLSRYNSDLANDLGNLVNRVLNMGGRYAGGVVPAAGPGEEPERELHALWEQTREEAIRLCEGFQFHTALDRTLTFIKAINRYVELRAPWKLAKSTDPKDLALLNTSLATMAEALRLGVTLLAPVTPGTTAKVYAALGHTPLPKWSDELQWGASLTGAKLQPGLVLFPRPEKPGAVVKPKQKEP
jgi:methionyl-tRNA synthetase